MAGVETRTVVMGHLQRGGSPTAFDRVLATSLGTKVVDMIADKKFGYMVGVRGGRLIEVSLHNVARGPRTVARNHPLIQSARAVGTCFGD
jgi:6-phosphofructokinase